MTVAPNLTTSNVRSLQEAGDTLTSTTVDTSVVEALPQEVHAVACKVDFGSGSDMARTTIVGQPWVKSTSRIVARIAGSTSDHDEEDALLEGVQVIATNFVAGVGFDVLAHAPDETFGTFNVHCVGV